jgi:hypothetical protein
VSSPTSGAFLVRVEVRFLCIDVNQRRHSKDSYGAILLRISTPLDGGTGPYRLGPNFVLVRAIEARLLLGFSQVQFARTLCWPRALTAELFGGTC